MANVTPLGDRILARRSEHEEQKSGGIIIPDTAKEKPLEAEVVAVGAGKIGEPGAHGVEACGQHVEDTAHLQDHRRIDNVLAGRAPMDEVCGFTAHRRAQLFDEVDHRHAGAFRPVTESGEVGLEGCGGSGDVVGGALRNDAKAPLYAGKRHLDGKHLADGGGVADQRCDFRVR